MEKLLSSAVRAGKHDEVAYELTLQLSGAHEIGENL
jgi:hypothetical protein